MRKHCIECGDSTKPLTRVSETEYVCTYRGGCEHRQFQQAARIQRYLEEMARLDSSRSGGQLVFDFGFFVVGFEDEDDE